MTRQLLIILCLVVTSVLGPIPTARAQDDPLRDVVFLCIVPENPTPNGKPYLIGFRSAEAVGLVLSEKAIVTVYGLKDSMASAAVFHILPDTPSGGYRRISEIARAYTRPNIPAPRPCQDDYLTFSEEYKNFSLQPQKYDSSIPLPVSQQQAIIVQRTGDHLLDSDASHILGTVGLYFTATTFTGMRSFQFLQIGTDAQETVKPIELIFPFLSDQPGDTEEFQVALFANKDMSVQRGYSLANTIFLPQTVSSPRDIFIIALVHAEPQQPTLFPIMAEHGFRLYPAYGLMEKFPAGGVIKLQLSALAAERKPGFTDGGSAKLINLTGTIVRYYLNQLGPIASSTGSVHNPEEIIPVVRVDTQGQMIIERGGQFIIESWWLEPVQ